MDYRRRLHDVIPGGAHTYSRGDDQYPSNAPSILSRGRGCYVWDADDNKFLDYGMGLRSVTVGYAYDPIAKAAISEIYKGNNMPRATLIELEAAETIVDLIESADMVKFAKNGSTVTTAAVKLARAYTGREHVAICADHPFFSYDDWFIGSTVVERGIPAGHKSLTLKFSYNDIASLKKLFDEYPKKIAAVILEPVTNAEPKDDFLNNVKDLCKKNGSVLIFDEMITGFRWHIKGAQKYFGVEPDLSTFGKGIANGFSVAALTGKKEIMNLGGILKEGEEKVFLISTTHGAEMSSLGAMVKTIDVYKKLGVVEHIWKYGKKLVDGVNAISKDMGIKDHFYFEGYPCSPNYVAKDKYGRISLELRTLFSQEMVKSGVLMPWIAISYSHGNKELEMTLEAAKKALGIYSLALEKGARRYLKGKAVKPVFRKLN